MGMKEYSRISLLLKVFDGAQTDKVFDGNQTDKVFDGVYPDAGRA